MISQTLERAALKVARVQPAMTRLLLWRLNVSNQAMALSERSMGRCRFVLEISGRIISFLSGKLKSLQSNLDDFFGSCAREKRNAKERQNFWDIGLSCAKHQLHVFNRQNLDGLSWAFDRLNQQSGIFAKGSHASCRYVENASTRRKWALKLAGGSFHKASSMSSFVSVETLRV